MKSPTDSVSKKTILVVDDTPDNLALMAGLLKDEYRVKLANSGEKALSVVRGGSQPDLILLDVMMPGMSGYEVCEQLKADPETRHIPVIFLTAMTAAEDEKRGLDLGAADYTNKPVNPPIVLARVKTHLENKRAAEILRDKDGYLRAEVARQTRLTRSIQAATIVAIAALAETREPDNVNHIQRTQRFVEALAQRLKDHPRFRAGLTPDKIEQLVKSAPLHDIGKLGMPESIRCKSGRFAPHEFAIMKTHTTLGRDAITQAESALAVGEDRLTMAREIAYSHQEKWDGSGYPRGLSGDGIPISARLMAVADVYDALIRPSGDRASIPHAQAVSVIQEGSGRHFDPDVVEAFTACAEAFREIVQRHPPAG